MLAAQAVVVSVALTAWWASGNDAPAMATIDAGRSTDAIRSGSPADAALPLSDGGGATEGSLQGVDTAASDAAATSAQDGPLAGEAAAPDQLTSHSDLPAGGLANSSTGAETSGSAADNSTGSGNPGSGRPDDSDDSDDSDEQPGTSVAGTSPTNTTTSSPGSATPGSTTSTPTTTVRPNPSTTPTNPSTSTQPSNTQPSNTQPTTTSTIAPEPDRGCTVSTLLVPSCGAWLGSSTPSRDGTFNYAQGLVEYEAIAQSVPDIIHFYKTGAATFPTAAEVALSERPGRQHSLLLYNWKPSITLTWRQIADGAADQNIRVVAEGLKRYPGRFFLAIHHEPENDQGAVGSGRTPADYVAMYRHVVTMLRALGVTNAVYVMNFMGFAGWAPVADEFYPGDDVVDWIAYDPYAHAGQSTFAQLLNRPSGDWPGFYAWATARAPGTPIMLGEWGFDLANQPLAPAAVDVAADTLEAKFPMVKALVYWNNRTAAFDYRLGQPTAIGQAFDAAYARMADDPYFNSTPVSAIVATRG